MLENLPEAAKMIGSSGLFMMAAANGPQTVNKTRILEAVITAIVVGVLVSYSAIYVALPVIKEQIDQLRNESKETRQLIKDIKQELDMRGARRDATEAALKAEIVKMQIEQARRH